MVPSPTPAVPPRRRRRPPLALAAAAVVGGLGVWGGGCTPEPIPFHENAVGVLKQNSLSRQWFVDLNLHGDGRQVDMLDVRRKLMYVYTADKRVTAIDRQTGVVQFTMTVSSPESRLQPVTELEHLLVFANATGLQVYDDAGHFVKAVPLANPLRSHAAAESCQAPGTNRGSTVYFGASGNSRAGLVQAFDVGRAAAFKKWEYITHAQGAITAAPVAYRDLIYSGDSEGEVDAVSADRVQVWGTDHGVFLTGGPIVADLRADDAGLYVPSGDTKLYCINRTTGKLQWQYFSGSALIESPVLTADTIYQVTETHGLVALDNYVYPVPASPTEEPKVHQPDLPPTKQFDRKPKWSCPAAEQFLAQDARFVYVAQSRPNPAGAELPRQRFVVALDRQTGRPAFESDHHDFTQFGTNTQDSLVYVAFADGKLMALQPVLRPGQVGELVMSPVSEPVAVAVARSPAGVGPRSCPRKIQAVTSATPA